NGLSWLAILYTLPSLTKTYLPPPLMQASVQSRSVIPGCAAVILAWLAPHILSLICPFQVCSASNDTEQRIAGKKQHPRSLFTIIPRVRKDLWGHCETIYTSWSAIRSAKGHAAS